MFQCVKPGDESMWLVVALVTCIGLWGLVTGLTWLVGRFGRKAKRQAGGECEVVTEDGRDVSFLNQ